MKKIFTGLVISLIVIAVLLAATERPMRAEGPGSGEEISKKMDEMLKAQRATLDGIAYIKEELRIIKIRVTQAQ